MSRKSPKLIDVSIQGPDELRRTRLLGVMVKGMLVMAAFCFIATIITDQMKLYSHESIMFAYMACGLFFLCTVVVYIIKRYVSAKFARIIFLSLLTLIVAFSDEPIHVASGRASLTFTIPIIMASVLFAPYTSFIVAFFASVIIAAIAVSIQIIPDIFIMFSYFFVALVSWLAARSLENALHEIQALNDDLDRRVQERTHDLSESLAKNQAIIESTADGVLVFDNDNRITVANQAMAELISRSTDEIVGCDIKAILSLEVVPGDREAVLQYFAEKNEVKSGLKFRCRNRTLSVSLAPIRDDTGEEKSAVAVFRDFSREAEIDRMKSTFVSIASHELRTPISAIMGLVDMLLQGVRGKLTNEQQKTMERVAMNAEQMIGLVNNLLDKSRLEAGKLQLDFRPFSLQNLLDGIMDLMPTMTHSKKLELSYHIADTMPGLILGDEQRLRQILVNLVNNAIKHTDKGSVCVTVYKPDDEHWAIAVKDTGCGIPPEGQNYLFNPFYQDDQSSRKYGGVGLGLSIVKQLVEHMGGVIKLQSTPGTGSTFTVELPFTAQRVGGEGPCALVVDDDPLMIELYSYTVRATGFKVEAKESGDKAMEWLRNNTPCLVILDLNLPGISGMDILQYIRNESRLQNVKVIVVTGYKITERVSTLAEHVLEKPFNPHTLHELVAQYYNK